MRRRDEPLTPTRLPHGLGWSTLAAALLALAVSPGPSGAQTPVQLALAAKDTAPADTLRSETPPAKEIQALRIGANAVILDGRVDEEIWKEVPFRSDFRQKGKDRSFEPRVRTEVAFLFDDEALYVGARMETDGPSGPKEILARRDEVGNSERILVSLDTYRDRQTSFTFGVTVAGVRVDHVQARDNEGWADKSFDPIWDAEVSRDSTSWSAEMRIPFSQLRFTPSDKQAWGLNVRRWNPATFLNLYWVAVPYHETGWASRFGELQGVEGISGGAQVEVVPYLLGRTSMLDESFGPSDPDTRTRFGGDAKLGMGSNLTLDVTVNPDFGQVEADPARVNLTAFETFFPEKRPFFMEGRELFRSRGPNWFYSRRVGSAPQAAVGRDLFEKVENATILGGAKIAGRLPTGLSVAALTAVSDRESVPLSPATGPETVDVAPRTFFGIGRLQQEVGQNGSSVGFMGTWVERFLAEDGLLSDVLPNRSLAGGMDMVIRLGGGQYEISGYAGGSHVSGSPEAITRLQLSSAHYFQRPDAGQVEVDPELGTLTGWVTGLKIGKIAGAQWTWDLEVSAASPGFEIRDAGSQGRADRVDAKGGVHYEKRDSKGAIRNHSLGIALASSWNFGGIRRSLSPSAFASAVLGNLWNTSLQVGMNIRSLSDDLTRGGPLMTTPQSWWTNLSVSSANSNTAWWSTDASGFIDEVGGWSTSLSAGWTVLPRKWLQVSVFGGGSTGVDSRQFVAALEGGPSETYGQRYVFSSLDRDELFAQLRTRLAFAPDAVLTLYAEPFISSGRAHDFGELASAGAMGLRKYGEDGTAIVHLDDGTHVVLDGVDNFRIENYDFWVRSLRGSAVLQWEWRRGSSLFLIWQKNQWSFADRSGPTDPDALFRSLQDPGEDIFVAKVSFLMGSR